MTDIVAEIAAASKEQLTGIEQVNKAIAQMDRVTQGNAAQTEEMSGTAGMLLSHSQQLSNMVDRFRLEDDSEGRSSKRQTASHAPSKPTPVSYADPTPALAHLLLTLERFRDQCTRVLVRSTDSK